jgi:FkbM family methyltransferase
MISRLRYYLSLIPVSLWQIQNRAEMLALLFGRSSRTPILLRLRDGKQFRVRTAMDVWIIIETCLGHDYEQNGFDIRSDWRIIDIGAGLGEFAVMAAKKCPEGVVYAYEPFRESFALMQENIALNHLGNIRAFPYAVGGSPGEMHLKTASGVPVLYSTAMNDPREGKDDAVVQATTLDEIFAHCDIRTCDLLKMDCEGAEYDILFHAIAALQNTKRIALEYHNGITESTHLDLVRFLERSGFSVITKPSPVHSYTGLLFAWR